MEEPPEADEHGHQHQSKNLVAHVDAPLLIALFLRGNLFAMRLDACVDHRAPLLIPTRDVLYASRISIGEVISTTVPMSV